VSASAPSRVYSAADKDSGITVSVLDEVTSLTGNLETSGKNRDKKLTEEFESLKTFIREQATHSVFRQQLALLLKDNEHKQALEWLMPLERQQASSGFHTSLYRRRAFGTGSWFIGGAVFQKWQEDQNACLWLRGQGKIPLFHCTAQRLWIKSVVGRVFCGKFYADPHGRLDR
jgi:hypothetical protein